MSQLIQLPDDARWYLPVTLAVGGTVAGAGDVVFALVPGRELVAGAKVVYPAPDAFVAILAQDGRRLVKYLRGSDSFQFNGRPVTPESTRILQQSDTGNFQAVNTLDGQEAVFGFSHSPSMPIVEVTGVPVSTLNAKWIRQSVSADRAADAGRRHHRHLRHPPAQRRCGCNGPVLAKQESTWPTTRHPDRIAQNRDSFPRLFEREIERYPTRPFAVVVMDVNNFKDVNDTLGHAAGDQLLRELGERLRGHLDAHDASVARLGGDEMAVFIRRAQADIALEPFSAGLRSCISERIRIDGVELEPMASMGGALYPSDAETPNELMRCADIAMYAAKENSQPFAQYSEG